MDARPLPLQSLAVFQELMDYHREEGGLKEQNNPPSLVIQIIRISMQRLGLAAELVQARFRYRLHPESDEHYSSLSQAIQLITPEGEILVDMYGSVGRAQVERQAMFLAAARVHSWVVASPGWHPAESMTSKQLEENAIYLPILKLWVSQGMSRVCARFLSDGTSEASGEQSPRRI